tara:strand:+ start:33472 stop:34593 length:1122 start_codon:yes stop_codon:yes gene_type:complete
MRVLRIRVENETSLNKVKVLLQNLPYKFIKGKVYTQKPLPYWEGMPTYVQVRKDPYGLFELDVTGRTKEELSFALEQPISDKTKSVWYPRLIKRKRLRWKATVTDTNQHPLYVISKGRPTCMTSKALDVMGASYKIVVEPVDEEAYLKQHPASNLLVTDFSDLGQGSIPVRNFVWDHAQAAGYTHHWVIDDNIEAFNILYNNTKDECDTVSIFKYAEDFVSLFDNVKQAGFNYYSFCKATDAVPPYYINTRIYSCILVDHSIPFRWRGKYNEDTDFSLRVLKAGYCTILFNMFLAGKVTTQRMSGGNTDNVYTDNDERRKFAQALKDQHPDVVKVARRFNRFHHAVDYRGFTQSLNRVREPHFNHEGKLHNVA